MLDSKRMSTATASRRHVLAAAVLAAVCAPGPLVAQEGWQRDGFALKKGKDTRIGLAGYVQGDLLSRRDFGVDDEDADNTPTLNETTASLGRLRIGLYGEWKRLSFEATVDPEDEGSELKDLYGELKVAKALRLRGGHFKVPVSAEFLTSASKIDFIERAMLATNIGPARDWGGMAFGEPARWLTYQVGVFKGDGRVLRTRSERTVAGRLVWSPVSNVDVGGSFSIADVEAEPAGEGLDPRAKGFLGLAPSGFVFYDNHFVNGRRDRLGFEVRLTPGPVGIRGEWMYGREEREGQGSTGDDLPDQVSTGWTASATWLLTGEKKERTIKPRRTLSAGGFGAWEIGIRYEELNFDDDGPDSGFEGAGDRARNIRPAGDRSFVAGLSWWPERWARLMFNVVVERFEDPLLAPEPGRKGDYVTLLGRFQILIP
jgi:phosphate-selective porin OprO and OprP